MIRMALGVVFSAWLLSAPVSAQDDPGRDNDPIAIPPGQTELLYRHTGDVPRQLRTALRTCTYEHWLPDIPVRVIRPDPDRTQLIVLAPCGHITNQGTAFKVGRWWQPEPIEFIVAAEPVGFTTDRHPGSLAWHPDTQTLTATRVTDVCSGGEKRHSYRYNQFESPFTLLKVEYRPLVCNASAEPQWAVSWEAHDWPQHRR